MEKFNFKEYKKGRKAVTRGGQKVLWVMEIPHEDYSYVYCLENGDINTITKDGSYDRLKLKSNLDLMLEEEEMYVVVWNEKRTTNPLSLNEAKHFIESGNIINPKGIYKLVKQEL